MASIFEDNHPLHDFKKDFYLESGRYNDQVYIFKFGKKGAQVVIDTTKYQEPLAFVYPLIFNSEYYWEEDKTKKILVITAKTETDIYEGIKKELRFLKYGKKSRKDS